MPITIQTNTCRDLVPLATIRFAQENVCRAKVIEIVDPIDNLLVWDSDILDELRRPSTLPLERLVVELQRPRLTSHPSRSFTTLNTPFLYHVSLTNTFIPITSSLLTYLEIIHNPPLSISSALPWSLLWKAIKGSSQLQVIRLIQTVPFLTPHEMEEHRREPIVNLPHLTELRAYGFVKGCQALWAHLIVPATAMVDVCVDCAEDWEADGVGDVDTTSAAHIHRLTFIQELLSHARALRPDMPVTGLSIVEDNISDILRLRFCTHVNGLRSPSLAMTHAFACDFTCLLDITLHGRDQTSELSVDVLQYIGLHFDASSIEVLELYSPTFYEIDQLHFRPLISLFFLSPRGGVGLEGSKEEDFVNMLRFRTEINLGLQSLSVKDVRLACKESLGWMTGEDWAA
ncbi:hypothetical protein OF83DRAFT_1085132 [Amylostereum chailletii]|nr:hypothetical protein OF83DRAFT_1085132 [Amylostereum chailletii]